MSNVPVTFVSDASHDHDHLMIRLSANRWLSILFQRDEVYVSVVPTSDDNVENWSRYVGLHDG